MFWGASINGQNFYGVSQRGDSGGWQATTFDLTNVYNIGNLLGQPQVWIAFQFFSDYSVTLPEGAYVDEIVLRKRTTLDASVPSPGGGPGCVVERTGDESPGALRCMQISVDQMDAGRR